MLLSSTCVACQTPGPSLCRRCRFSLVAVPPVPAHHGPDGVLIRGALPFDGIGRQLVVGLKYRNRRAAAAVLAGEVVARARLPEVDVVTWAPTSGRRAARRGFDQAELLAREVARVLGVPCRRLLYRQHDNGAGASQTTRRRWERLIAPGFRTHPRCADVRVLVVDDVVTTGATLGSAVGSLRRAGIRHVYAVAAAVADRSLVALRRAG